MYFDNRPVHLRRFGLGRDIRPWGCRSCHSLEMTVSLDPLTVIPGPSDVSRARPYARRERGGSKSWDTVSADGTSAEGLEVVVLRTSAMLGAQHTAQDAWANTGLVQAQCEAIHQHS